MLNSQDKVGRNKVQRQHLGNNIHLKYCHLKPDIIFLSNPPQVFNEIRNEHFSNVFGFLSQKAKNLQTAYDVGGASHVTRYSGSFHYQPPEFISVH